MYMLEKVGNGIFKFVNFFGEYVYSRFFYRIVFGVCFYEGLFYFFSCLF